MRTTRPLERADLRNLGSLITYTGVDGAEACVGDLAFFEGRGAYDPTLGRLPLTRDEAEAHNAALNRALLEGLDQNCAVGQGGYAYLGDGRVTTFVGTEVSSDVTVRGASVTFRRKGKTYRGRLRKDGTCFNYRRVA